MSETLSLDEAYAQICTDYCQHADAGRATELAALYTPDGVFDRVGQRFEGRDAISKMLASRPPEVWTEHRCSNLSVQAESRVRALGQADLFMRRGRKDSDKVEEVRARCVDTLVCGDDGWHLAVRVVQLQK